MRSKQTVVSVLLSLKNRSIALSALVLLLLPQTALAVDVTLAWKANTEPDLAGYAVFVRGVGETYEYDRPEWEGTDTICTVYGLDGNTFYYFVVRSFDTLGNESGDSNEVYTYTLASTSCPYPNGHGDYCRDCGPCGPGEGDCDGDDQCESGLICATDVGADYGFSSSYDVCEQPDAPSCPYPNGHGDYCRDCGPCGAGEGDCDGDDQCESGLICATDVGADYGFPSNYDVCERS